MAKYRFRLLAGQHIEADKSKPRLDAEGNPTGRFERKVFNKGDIIDTDTDLAAKLGANKFELLGGGGSESRVAELEREIAELKAKAGVAPVAASTVAPAIVTPPDDGLDAKTIKELRDYAADEEISLHGAHTKDDILKAIRQTGKGK